PPLEIYTPSLHDALPICAYIVGRLINQGTTYPFAIALLRAPSGHIRLDALLHAPDDLTTLFSFTRAYFLVDMETPAAYVHFLSRSEEHTSELQSRENLVC